METAQQDARQTQKKKALLEVVSVVLLSYNRPAYLDESLASLTEQSYERLEIIVVDNPSPASAAVAGVVSRYPNVKLIQTNANLGYCGGTNVGIEQATGEYLFLTEDDIVLQSDCIERLVEYMKKDPSSQLASPITYNRNTKTIRCAGGEFVLGGVYSKKIYGAGEPDTGQFSQPFDVRHIDGGTIFMRRDFWKRFKGFREEYFMYVEALELSARVAKAGGRMTVVPQAKVYHFEPTLGPTPPELEFHKLKNFFSLYLLHAPARVLPEFFCRYALINGLRSIFRRSGTQPQVFFKALLWVMKRTPSLMRERFSNN